MNTGKRVLIFDLGGVVLDIYADRTFRAFAELGLQPAFLNEAYCINDGMMQRFECGSLSADDMFSYVEAALSGATNNIPADELRRRIVKAWCAMLGNVDTEKLQRLLQLRAKGYRVILLSNTNVAHWKAIEERFGDSGFTPRECFDKLYLSFEMGYIKPDKNIFLRLLDAEGVSPCDCLFFDDSQANCDAAMAIGIDAVVVERNAKWSGTIIDSL